MTRLSGAELEEVKKEYNVSRLWSWSRINTFMTSPYEYYLHYVLGKKEDNDNCAYAPIGGISHSILEKFYTNEIKYENMIGEFRDGWTTAIEIAELKFNRSDEEKNESIGNKYKEDLIHFFMHHNPIEEKVIVEKFVTAKIGNSVLQGYIDAIFKDKAGCFNILDWKTSSKFSPKALEEKSGQLVVYAIALTQLGVPLDKIKIGFNMLKYCTVEYEQKNGTTKTRDIERCKIGESLQSNVGMWLKAMGYEDEKDDYLKQLLDCNSIEVLPEEVQKKYTVSDCYVYVPLTEKLINKWHDAIVSTIMDIHAREKDYKETGNDKVWWDTEENVKEQSYYFANLCGYSPSLLKPYAEYLDKLEKESMDLFGGVGTEQEDSTNAKDNNTDDDLSWLNEI